MKTGRQALTRKGLNDSIADIYSMLRCKASSSRDALQEAKGDLGMYNLLLGKAEAFELAAAQLGMLLDLSERRIG